MKKIKIALAVNLLFLTLVSACNFYSDENLGANYWFWEDGNQSQIVYGKKGIQGGFTIIDANVSKYRFNDNYIIARSKWLVKNGMDAYWIIDKRIKINGDTSLNRELFEHEIKKGLIGPLIKDSFDLFIHKHHIDLKLQ